MGELNYEKKYSKAKSRIRFVFVLLILLLSIIGASYAGWTDSIIIDGTLTTQEDFTEPYQIGVWTFDENSGETAHDSSPFENHGTIYGAAWTLESISGSALSFNGIDQYVNCGNDESLDFSTENFTISLWMYINDQWTGGAGTNKNVSAIIDKGTGSRIDGYGIHFSGDMMKIRFSTDGDDNVYPSPSNTARKDLWNDDPLEYGQWYHVVAMREHGMKYIYINGNMQYNAQYDDRELSNPSRPLLFGKHDVDSGGYFNGIIDEIKIFNRALTYEEIQALPS